MKYEHELRTASVDYLQVHPEYSSWHPPFDPHGADKWLLEDIRKSGVLVPLMVTSTDMVLDGRRRLDCCHHLHISDVPVLELSALTVLASFRQFNLGRKLSVYAACMIFRDDIRSLLKRLNEEANVDEANEWIGLGHLTGYSEAVLRDGHGLLIYLDNLDKDELSGDKDKSDRIRSIFRSMGLAPAMRLIGETASLVNEELDPGEWAESNPSYDPLEDE